MFQQSACREQGLNGIKNKAYERLRITSQKQHEMDNQTHKFKKIRYARRFTHHICTKLYRWLASWLFRRLGNC